MTKNELINSKKDLIVGILKMFEKGTNDIEETADFILSQFFVALNEQKVKQVQNAALSYTEKQANQKAATAIRDFCKSVMHEDSDLHKDSTAWIKENLGIDICYKTNEPCKFDCKGLCRESY